jgi:phenylacetate-CoA ligase
MRDSDRWEAAKPKRAMSALHKFFETPLDKLLDLSGMTDPATETLALFHDMAARVPGYRRFLNEHGIDPESVRETDDLLNLPLTDKANYLQRHPLADLCRDGRIESCDMMAVSSGSTGKPTFWPRFLSDELVTAVRFEQAFHDSFAADRRRTLAVVCFALGTWVGGLFTAACCRHLAAKGYPVMVVAPGNNKAEIWRVVRELAPQFEQTVLLGYPPFLKDVIDGGIVEGIDWRPFQLKLVMAGEVFSEEWRDLIAARAGIAEPAFGSVALYGTADAGVLGNETPLSITIRRFLSHRPEMARELFGESRLPTLVQYDPRSRYFETQDGTLLFSGNNGVPLLRYHIADTGGVIPYDRMLRFLAKHGFDPTADLLQDGDPDGMAGRGARPLPFVYVFGRSNFTVSYFGANIYPENITVGLEQDGIASFVTGKFVLQAVEGLDDAPHLAIAVELAPGVEADQPKRDSIAQSILAQLLRLNSEFQAYTPPEFRLPRVTLKPTGDPDWFPVGVKHRYTRK